MTKDLMEAARVAEAIPAGASVALKPNLVVAGSLEDGVRLALGKGFLCASTEKMGPAAAKEVLTGRLLQES